MGLCDEVSETCCDAWAAYQQRENVVVSHSLDDPHFDEFDLPTGLCDEPRKICCDAWAVYQQIESVAVFHSPDDQHLGGSDLLMDLCDETQEICCDAWSRYGLRSVGAWDIRGQLETALVLHLLNDSYLTGADPSMSLCHAPLETCFDSSWAHRNRRACIRRCSRDFCEEECVGAPPEHRSPTLAE